MYSMDRWIDVEIVTGVLGIGARNVPQWEPQCPLCPPRAAPRGPAPAAGGGGGGPPLEPPLSPSNNASLRGLVQVQAPPPPCSCPGAEGAWHAEVPPH